MMKEKSRSPPKWSNGRLPLILLVYQQPARTRIVKGAKALILPFTICGIAGTSRTARIRNHNQLTYQNRKK